MKTPQRGHPNIEGELDSGIVIAEDDEHHVNSIMLYYIGITILATNQ